MTAEFADYLRHNLNTLNQNILVSFEDELKHTKVYPGTHHAAACGKCGKAWCNQEKIGGTVTISTRERETCHEIIIAADGVGFDSSRPLSETDTHIGIENVRDRLQSMCEGVLTIESKVGVGTVATIKIPKQRMPQ